MTDCFYCGEPILPNDPGGVVIGAAVEAHQACVHRELDRVCPNWRVREVSGRAGNGKGAWAKPATRAKD
jgi:hypothetical protein